MNATSDSKKRYFTPTEANQMLPLVRAIVADIVALYGDVHERRTRLRRIRGEETRDESNPYRQELDQIEAGIEQDIRRLEEFFIELRDLGIELKDPASGLIDFPTLIDGREAYLCWKYGEDEVAFWHELDAGFAGRQSILEGSLPHDENEAG